MKKALFTTLCFCLFVGSQTVLGVLTDDPILSEGDLVYRVPAQPNGVAIVVCPGGAYHFLSLQLEWEGIAVWLNKHGITAVGLKYDVYKNHSATVAKGDGQGLYPTPMRQVDCAVRRVRRDASLYGLDPHKIGVMGFSAGGHLASTIATHFQPGDPTASPSSEWFYSSRPDFQVLAYPLITMEGDPAVGGHPGSRDGLLGVLHTDPEMVRYLSNEYQVTAATPKAFVTHGTGDTVVKIGKTREYVEALRAHGVDVTYREVTDNHGGFGWNMNAFYESCMAWLHEKVIAPCPHETYRGTVYTWKENAQCTASRVCETCGETMWEVARAYSEVTTEPTPIAEGARTYTVHFENPAFVTQTKTMSLPTTAHLWRTANAHYSWVETPDGWACTASNSCTCAGSSCPATTNETGVVEGTLVRPATVAALGLERYTATFAGPMFRTQTREVVLPAKPAPRMIGDYYVSPNGSDTLYDGTTPDTPFWTLTHALTVAADGQTICLLAGTHEVTQPVVVSKALRLVGESGRPEDVVVRNKSVPTASAPGPYRVFTLNHADAELSGLTIENGQIGGVDAQGGNVLIATNGGTVSNCIVRNARILAYDAVGNPKTRANGAGIASLSAQGLITHCVITNNLFSRGDKSSANNPKGASGVYLQAGLLRASIVADNVISNDAHSASISLENAARVEACTVDDF